MPTPLPYPRPIQETAPELFIIESLNVEDEISHRFEGRALVESLRLNGMRPAYYYVHDYAELKQAAELFRHSSYRWLHISAHGSPAGVATTLEGVTNQEFADLFNEKLKNRRVFFSSCEVGSGELTTLLRVRNKGMYSVASPIDPISFGTACAFWTAFYTRTLTENPLGMEVGTLSPALSELCKFFSVKMHWSWYNPAADQWNEQQMG